MSRPSAPFASDSESYATDSRPPRCPPLDPSSAIRRPPAAPPPCACSPRQQSEKYQHALDLIASANSIAAESHRGQVQRQHARPFSAPLVAISSANSHSSLSHQALSNAILVPISSTNDVCRDAIPASLPGAVPSPMLFDQLSHSSWSLTATRMQPLVLPRMNLATADSMRASSHAPAQFDAALEIDDDGAAASDASNARSASPSAIVAFGAVAQFDADADSVVAAALAESEVEAAAALPEAADGSSVNLASLIASLAAAVCDAQHSLCDSIRTMTSMRSSSMLEFWKFTMSLLRFLVVGYLLGFTWVRAGACLQPLRAWALVHVGVRTASSVAGFVACGRYLPPSRRKLMHAARMGGGALSLAVTAFGAWWLAHADGCQTCSPEIFYLAASLLITDAVFLVLPAVALILVAVTACAPLIGSRLLAVFAAVLRWCCLVESGGGDRRRRDGASSRRSTAVEQMVAELDSQLFSAADDCDAHNTQCGVCLDTYADGDRLRILPCRHRFHAACVDTWLLARAPPTCPFCRFEIGAERVEDEAARQIENARAPEARGAAVVHV